MFAQILKECSRFVLRMKYERPFLRTLMFFYFWKIIKYIKTCNNQNHISAGNKQYFKFHARNGKSFMYYFIQLIC
jgi:hypothetical protein